MKPQTCIHHWHIDSREIGTCSFCGKVENFQKLQLRGYSISKARKGGAK